MRRTAPGDLSSARRNAGSTECRYVPLARRRAAGRDHRALPVIQPGTPYLTSAAYSVFLRPLQENSEFKTDLDGERLPSGKFATHALVLGVSMLAYNVLQWIGQNGLMGRRSASSAEPYSPKRYKARRRRIRTVMQELMVVAARVIKTAGSLKLAFGQGCRSRPAFEYVYRKLAYGWLSLQPNKPLV